VVSVLPIINRQKEGKELLMKVIKFLSLKMIGTNILAKNLFPAKPAKRFSKS